MAVSLPKKFPAHGEMLPVAGIQAGDGAL